MQYNTNIHVHKIYNADVPSSACRSTHVCYTDSHIVSYISYLHTHNFLLQYLVPYSWGEFEGGWDCSSVHVESPGFMLTYLLT